MNEPKRLRESGGPAAALLASAELEVPTASRKRALAFTGVAASMLASSGATAASGAALVKSVMLWVAVGTVGGGLMSVTVAETISHFDARSAGPRTAAPPLPLPPPRATATPTAVAPAPEPAPPSPTPVVTEAPAVAPPRAASVPKPSAPAATSGASAEAPKPVAVSNLFDEQRSIEAARAAVSHGNPAAALSTLDDYERSYPRGQFGPEALALRVEALRAQGKLESARTFARQFERRYPHHPLLSRVRAAVAR
jgi:hypothetical protein